MLVIASSNGNIGIGEAMRILKVGGAALDAVEAGIRLVEANPNDHSVGYSGYPNLLGEVELDASIMDGRTLMSGAVGAVRGYCHVISLARKVMEHLPHVFLVAEGAERFAKELGFEKSNLLSAEAHKTWLEHLQQNMPADVLATLGEQSSLRDWVRLATDPERTKGTVNFIARDHAGTICSGVSTSGWAWKYPGRLGDSPIIGAGNYADNRYGAAACTGMGEMAIRACTAYSVVASLKQGLSLAAAGERAMLELNDLGGNFISDMNLIAMDKDGNHAGFSSQLGQSYLVQTADMSEAVELERKLVVIHKRWGQN